MDSFFTMLRLQLMLLIFLTVGIYIRKRNIITKEAQPYFTEFLARIALPCMIFNSFKSESGLEVLLSSSKALLVSFAVCLSSFVLGKILYSHISPERRSVMCYGTLVSNAGFAGLPQVQSTFGATGLLYASIYLIPLRIFMWSAGISLFHKADKKVKIKNILTNPGMLAVYMGLPRMLLQVPLPGAVDSAIKSIGDCTNPLSMIVIGMVVADIPWRTVIDKAAVALTFVRLLIIPMTVLLVMKAIHADSMLTGVSVILTAMPVGVNTPILAQKYGGDYEFASKCVLISTILSMITLPVISIFL